MSSWKESSDFASLAAALSQAKNLQKGNPKTFGAPADVEATTKVSSKSAGVNSSSSIASSDATASTIHGTTSSSDSPATSQDSYADYETPNLPVNNDIFLFKQHKSTISALEFESSGCRFLSGSHDTTVAYWDFNGMNREQPSPFRFIEPMGSYAIRSLKYSRDNQWVLVTAACNFVKLFDRNGSQVREFSKGDPYIRDLKHTKGHVSGVIGALWFPQDSDRFLTASEDGTIRVWHLGYRHKSELTVPVKSTQAGSGSRSALTAISFNSTGNHLVSGSRDGSLKLWDSKSASSISQVSAIDGAHLSGDLITSLAFDPRNEFAFASRSTDGLLKLWDSRKLTVGPVSIFNDLPALHAETGMLYCNGSLATGTTKGLMLLNPENAQERHLIPTSAAVVSLAWSNLTEQLVFGKSDGGIGVMFEEGRGNGRGASLMRMHVSNSVPTGEVDISPGELYSTAGRNRPSTSTKRKFEKVRADPVKSHCPELPLIGAGQGGRIGSNVTQSIMKSILKDTSRDVDPRAALLAYAEKAAQNPRFVDVAYRETQPVPVLDASLLEKEAAQEQEKRLKLEEAERLKAERERINKRFQ